jgi:hypothetical protein
MTPKYMLAYDLWKRGFSIQDIAEQLKVTEKTVTGSYLWRATHRGLYLAKNRERMKRIRETNESYLDYSKRYLENWRQKNRERVRTASRERARKYRLLEHCSKKEETHVKELSEAEKGYLAGLIDGEGTISIGKKNNKTGRLGFTLTPSVSIANTNEGVIRYCQSLIGGRVYKGRRRKPNHRTKFTLRVHRHTEIMKILEQVYPYLRIKKKNAELLMKYCESRIKKRRYISSVTVPYDEDELRIHQEIRKLNER